MEDHSSIESYFQLDHKSDGTVTQQNTLNHKQTKKPKKKRKKKDKSSQTEHVE